MNRNSIHGIIAEWPEWMDEDVRGFFLRRNAAYKSPRPTLDSVPIDVEVGSRRTHVAYELLRAACRAPFVPGRAKGDLGLIGIGHGGALYVGPAWGSHEIVMPCQED